MREDDPRTDHSGWRVRIGGVPCDDSHGAVFIRIGVSACSAESTIRKNNSGIGASGDGSVTGDFKGAYDLAKGLFAASASSEAFECGHSDCCQEAHNANYGKEFDEGEGRRRVAMG